MHFLNIVNFQEAEMRSQKVLGWALQTQQVPTTAIQGAAPEAMHMPGQSAIQLYSTAHEGRACQAVYKCT